MIIVDSKFNDLFYYYYYFNGIFEIQNEIEKKIFENIFKKSLNFPRYFLFSIGADCFYEC